jgi:GT2 family glycosyltransferase
MNSRDFISRGQSSQPLSPASSLPDVDCVIVNRDGGESLFSAVRSVQAQTEVDLSIVVVDNASRPEERGRLAADAPNVRIVAFSRNLGFAAAANEGIARTRAPFVLLVNNDAVLAPDYAARLAARLALDERLAAVQGVVLERSGGRVDTAGLEWNDRGEAVPVLAGADASATPAAVFEVTGVSATAALYRRDALMKVAPHGRIFDDRFFAYYEDVDLSLRLARAGWRFACEPQAVARHEGSRTGRRTPFRRAVWTARNRWRTLFANFSPRLLAQNLPALLRADLAHARRLGVAGAMLPLLVWPWIPFFAFGTGRETGLLAHWPTVGPTPARLPARAAGS